MAALSRWSLQRSALPLRAHGGTDGNEDEAAALELLGPRGELLDGCRRGARHSDRRTPLLGQGFEPRQRLGDVVRRLHRIDLDIGDRIVETERACDLPGG